MAMSITTSAFADLLADPYVGYGRYATSSSLSSTTESGAGITTVGARVGYVFTLASAGLDIQMDSLDGGTRMNTAAFAGIDMPILLRAWGKYIVNSKFENDDLGNAGYDLSFQSGYAVGLGYTGFPLLSLNFEIENSSYKYEHATLTDLYVDWVSYLFSVSFPLDL